MNPFLFDEFNNTSPAAWKQKIQADLKGADYNETLLWKTAEGITVKPFYTKEDTQSQDVSVPKEGFKICQSIFIDNEKIANGLAIDALKRGATAIEFVAKKSFDCQVLFKNIDPTKTTLYFTLHFLSATFTQELSQYTDAENTFVRIDILGHLAKTGNWFNSLKEDHAVLEKIVSKTPNCIGVNAALYQNSGANNAQQLAYALAQANEYITHFGTTIAAEIHFNFAVGNNYFFEIAKLRAFRILWKTLLEAHGIENATTHIVAQPSLRNKTLYDYNVNMLRTTSECMSAILGGADTVCNTSYDSIYHKSNEFGERISRNQLLILQQESGLANAQNFADGTYYIESITQQLAEKGLQIFKQIEQGGGFLKQLKAGNIQRKITESANKELEQFTNKSLVLLGSNKLPNEADTMAHELELYPFVKTKNHKTLLIPIVQKRIAEDFEKEKIAAEKIALKKAL